MIQEPGDHLTADGKNILFHAVRARVMADPLYVEPVRSGLCLVHAVHGILTLGEHGLRAVLQGGDCSWPVITPEQDDGVRFTHFSYEWSPETPASRIARASGRLMEVHAWIGLPDTQEIVDFTTGDLPEQARKLAGIVWEASPPPPYLWGRPPENVLYRPKKDATEYLLYRAAMLYGAAVLRRLVEISLGRPRSDRPAPAEGEGAETTLERDGNNEGRKAA